MNTLKTIWKPSTFRKLPISEYNKIPIKSLWLESIIHHFFQLKKSFRGMQTRILDIFFIIFFPVTLTLSIVFGSLIIYYDKKRYIKLAEQKNNLYLNTNFYCLDWKNIFSEGVSPDRYVDY